MKLGTKEVQPFLKQPTQANAVLIYGPDRGLVRQRMDVVSSCILTDLNDPFNRVDFGVEQLLEDPAALSDELAAMSFTGDRRLIVIREATDKLSSTIEEALPLLSDQNYLICWAEELGPRSSLRKLFESGKTIAALPCYKDEGVGLSQLVQDTLKGYGLRADREVVNYITQHLGGDRMIILNELEKISLYYGESEEPITIEAVRDIVGESNERSLDDVCSAVAGGQISALCKTLDRLFMEGVQGVAILRSVHRYFSRLSEIHQLCAGGQSMDQAVKTLKPPVFFKQQPVMKRHAGNWNTKRIQQAQHLMMEAEKETKLGGDMGSLMCTHYLMRIAKAAGR